MVFSDIGAYIDRETWSQNDAIMTGVHRTYSDVVSEVVSQNYGRGLSVVELGNLHRDVYVFKHNVYKMFLYVCKSELLYAEGSPFGPSKKWYFEV